MSEIPEELERWRARRQAELTSPESWLGLVGLFWLEPGLNRVGSADDAIVRLPGGPACLGDLHVEDGGHVTWRPVSGRSCGLKTDAAGEPSVVDHENWSFSSSTATVAWRRGFATATGRRASRFPPWIISPSTPAGGSRRNGSRCQRRARWKCRMLRVT